MNIVNIIESKYNNQINSYELRNLLLTHNFDKKDEDSYICVDCDCVLLFREYAVDVFDSGWFRFFLIQTRNGALLTRPDYHKVVFTCNDTIIKHIIE